MIDTETRKVEYVSPNVQRILGLSPRRCRRISTFYTLPETTAVHRGWKV